MASIIPTDDLEEMDEIEEDEGQQQRPMSEADIQSAARNAVTDAQNYIQNDVSEERLTGWEYYNGGTRVEAEPDRSTFVSMTVRDTIEAMVPSIMKIFTGAEYLVSATAKSANEAEQSAAADATEAFNDIFWNENPGWELLEGFTRDATIAKTGIFKAEMIDDITVSEVDYEGTVEEFELIEQQDEVTVNEAEGYGEPVQIDTPIGPLEVVQPMVEAELTIKERKRKLEITTISPENFLINRSATSLRPGGFTLVGERTPRLVSDVVAMGVPLEDAERHSGTGGGSYSDYQETEARARREQSTSALEDQSFTDPSTREVIVYDLYIRMDADGDGIAELHRIVGIGEDIGMIIEDEVVKDHPYALSSAISVPHAVIGHSVAENVLDLQDVTTQLRRAQLNNIAQVQNPRPTVGPNKKDTLDTVQDNRFGAPVNANPGEVDWLVYPFVGDKIEMVLQSFDNILGTRTGMNPESQGLDAKSLQASSEVGVLAVLGAGLTQPEMIAATMAHRALVRLFQLVIDLLRDEGTPVAIMSKGKHKEVSPAEWPRDMRFNVHVGLGTGRKEEKLAALMQTAALQKEILVAAYSTTGSFRNAFVTPEQYSRTLHQIGELSNLGQTTAYWNSPQAVSEYEQQAAQDKAKADAEPKPPPMEVMLAQLKAEAEQAKTDANNRADVLIQEMKSETDVTIQAMKDQVDAMQARLEVGLALLDVEQGEELSDNDINIEG